MSMFSIGNDTVGIVKRSSGSGRDRLNQATSDDDQVIVKAGCSFEVQPASAADARESTDGTTTVLQMVAFVTLPVDDDTVGIEFVDAIQFPVVDEAGDPVDGPVFEQAGEPVVETNSRGRRDHVALVVEYQAG